jgi:hypothetical protein
LTATNPEGAFTAENPPEFTAINPEAAGLGVSILVTDRVGGGAACMFDSPCDIEVFKAVDACIAGESEVKASDLLCERTRFIGDIAGEGENRPAYSKSSCCWTPGLTVRRYSSYG